MGAVRAVRGRVLSKTELEPPDCVARPNWSAMIPLAAPYRVCTDTILFGARYNAHTRRTLLQEQADLRGGHGSKWCEVVCPLSG